MTYELHDSNVGLIKVYRDAGYEYYLDINNKYDMIFNDKDSYAAYMYSVNAEYIGINRD